MIFDAHSDIWSDVTIRTMKGEKDILKKYHLSRLKEGQIEGGIFVIWADPPFDKTPFERTQQIMDAIKKETAVCKEITVVKKYEDILTAKETGKFYILIGLEGLSSIGDDISLLDQYYDFGARHAMLTWNEQNALATGVHGDPSRGLTELGKKAVKKMVENHMIIDVSHLNEKSFWDVSELVEGPIMASHSNAKTLCNAARNLSDDQLLAIRDLDGVIGINAFNEFVSTDMKKQTIDQLVIHIQYIAEKIGVEHIGFGFDFFEFLDYSTANSYATQDSPCTMGLEDCSKVPVLIEKLKIAGFTKKEIDAISFQNFHNLIQKVLG